MDKYLEIKKMFESKEETESKNEELSIQIKNSNANIESLSKAEGHR